MHIHIYEVGSCAMPRADFYLTCLLPSAISELFASSINEGQITLRDYYGLTATLSNSSLDEYEKKLINYLLRLVLKKLIRVEDTLSPLFKLEN
jgi:hypothetical protein